MQDGFPKVGSLLPIKAIIHVGFPKMGPLLLIEATIHDGSPKMDCKTEKIQFLFIS